MKNAIRFNRYHVTDGTTKARVSYSLDNRVDGRRCVTLNAKDYDDALGAIFGSLYVNNTDSMSDYFDKGRVVLFEDHPTYPKARARAEERKAAMDVKAVEWALKIARMREARMAPRQAVAA